MAKKNRLKNKKKKSNFSFYSGKKVGEIFKRKKFVFLKKITLYFFFAVALSFLAFNLYYSQKISPVYSKFSEEDRGSAVELAQSLRGSQYFDKVHSILINIYGKDFDNDIFKNEREQKSKINALEKLLEINPKSRDVLFGLYKLYNEKGETGKARHYLDKAREVDPGI